MVFKIPVTPGAMGQAVKRMMTALQEDRVLTKLKHSHYHETPSEERKRRLNEAIKRRKQKELNDAIRYVLWKKARGF